MFHATVVVRGDNDMVASRVIKALRSTDANLQQLFALTELIGASGMKFMKPSTVSQNNIKMCENGSMMMPSCQQRHWMQQETTVSNNATRQL
jgi:hypothetical protein